MSKTESFFLFTLKVKELKKTANYFNTVTNESFDLLQQYPNLINENRIFDEEINDDEIDSNDKSIKEEGIKLIFLSLLIYFEEFINSIITEIILQYKVIHIKQISNISKANFDKRYEFIRDSLNTGSINKNSNNINICIIIRNSIVHSSKAIKINSIPDNLKNKQGYLVLNEELLRYSFNNIEKEAKHINDLVINKFEDLIFD